jgi:hypothetical protein
MEYVIFFAILLFYIFRTLSKAQKKAKEEAERRRRMNEHMAPSPTVPSAPKSLEDVLTEVFREVETKSKPFGDKRTIPPVLTQKKHERKAAQQPVQQSPKQQRPAKKAPTPFLTSDYSAETIEPEGTPSAAMEDFIRKSQVTDAYLRQKKETARMKFSLRDAVIAKIILDRPEW